MLLVHEKLKFKLNSNGKRRRILESDTDGPQFFQIDATHEASTSSHNILKTFSLKH